MRRGVPIDVPMTEAALRSSLVTFVLMIAYEQAARVRKWRRNLIRAGGVFATSWIGGLLLALTLQIVGLASAAGFDLNRDHIYAVVVGALLILRADQLPKSRPAWFNGIALPIFASRNDVWRRVHRASAIRLFATGLLALLLAAFAPKDSKPMAIVMGLMLIELFLATGHALWLGATTSRREG
ncbi:hypothetical protein IC614_01950 [Allosphingosinicella flava]|uniref:Uncharacterized protein n=2 Tax=Allosphingosinicella flava TaxID=2771430 RepID=A0A7T2GKW5_9SPHN|nr:hypothetical protein IC614_01950 [Sphingosinicella flava]